MKKGPRSPHKFQRGEPVRISYKNRFIKAVVIGEPFEYSNPNDVSVVLVPVEVGMEDAFTNMGLDATRLCVMDMHLVPVGKMESEVESHAVRAKG